MILNFLIQKLILILLGQICDEHGTPLPHGTPPTPCELDRENNDWTPYKDQVQFKVTDFLYCCNQMSAGDIGLWVASLAAHNNSPPFRNAKDMYNTIDTTALGYVPWQSFTLNYNGSQPETLGPDGEEPPWTTANYNIWFHDPRLLVHKMIGNLEFKDDFDFTPYQEYSMDGQHRFEDFMSGDWAWKQAVS